MLDRVIEQLSEEYARSRPDATIRDPIEVAHFLKELRRLHAVLEALVGEIAHDETRFLARFTVLTSMSGVEAPTEFASIPQQATIVDTIRLFIKRNRGVEFRCSDIVRACGLTERQRLTVRTNLRRMVEENLIKRKRQGVYVAVKKKKKKLEPKNDED